MAVRAFVLHEVYRRDRQPRPTYGITDGAIVASQSPLPFLAVANLPRSSLKGAFGDVAAAVSIVERDRIDAAIGSLDRGGKIPSDRRDA
jgi:hypothetical protein